MPFVEQRRPESESGERARRDRRADHDRTKGRNTQHDTYVSKQGSPSALGTAHEDRFARVDAVALAARRLFHARHPEREQ